MAAPLTSPNEVSRFFQNLAGAVAQPKFRPALQKWTDETQQALGESFEREETPDGRPWPKWQFRSFSIPAAGKKTLQSSGLLLKSIIDDIAEHVERVTDTTAEMGTAVPYASKHQEGGQSVTTEPLVSRDGRFILPSGRTINIPQREFLGLTNALADRAEELIGEHIDTLVESL